MYYVYLLKSKLHNQLYVGSTNDLRKRLKEHNDGKAFSTKRYKPWKLIYYEAYEKEDLARMREKRLKYHGNAIRELKKRVGLLRPRTIKNGAVLPRTIKNGAVLPRTIKNGAGFTLVELLVAISITAILFGIGIAQYNQFSRRQILVQAAQELKNNLRFAQGKALAGDKPADCVGVLQGYKLVFSDEKTYEIKARCGGEDLDIGALFALPGEAIKSAGLNEVLFKALAQGVENPGEFYLSGYGRIEKIVVEEAGNIYREPATALPTPTPVSVQLPLHSNG